MRKSVSVTYEQTLNRFPLRGIHLQVLASGTPSIQNRGTGLPDATSRRTIHELLDWQILRRNPDNRREFLVDDYELQQAVFAASQERSDLFEALEQASALQLLASLPTYGSPRTLAATGLSRPTVRSQMAQLHRRNYIQRLDGNAAINPGLPGLQRLVQGYRGLQAQWVDSWSVPLDSRGPVTHLPIHQRGVEAAWSLRNADTTDLPAVDWRQAFFQPLAPVRDIVYCGPRDLTNLDEMLLLVRAEAEMDYRVNLTREGVEAQDPRIMGLLAAGLSLQSLRRRSIEATFAHYRLEELYDGLLRAFRRNDGAVMMFRQRYLSEFNIEEDCLA